MDSCATLHGAPRSFATLYDAAPPFSTNLSSGDFRFSSLPTKRNAAAPETSILFQLGETLKRAASPLSRNSENGKNQRSRSLSPVRQHIDDSYLDFERVLKPLMDNTRINVVVAGSAPVLDQPHYRQSQGHRCLSTSDIPVVPVSLQSSDPQMRSDPYLRPPPQRRNPFMVEEHRNSIINLPSSNQWSLLNSLRIHAGTPERSEDGIEKLLQYYAQLLNLSQKFDFESGRHSINFNWYEAYSPDRQITHSCIHYEMACVLFNVAAVYSQIACAQRLSTTDGKKLAAAYFKKSAGVLMHVRDTHCQRAQIRLEKTSDLTDQFLTASAQVMLAQAMECYFEKANDDKVSSPTMSMLATQTADYYELALRHSKEGIHILSRQRFPRTWIQQLTAKSFIYAAIAHFHAPLSLPAEQALGERIARLTIAKNLATRAFKSSSSIGGTVHDIVKGYLDVITSSHLLADAANFEKHNHAAVDASLVTALKRPNEALVVPIPAAESIGDLQRFSDVFAGFKPVEEDLNLEVLSTFAVEVVERASRNLEAHRKEIEAEIKRHNVMETSTLKEILSVNKERANAIWEHIQVIQMDERKEPYSDLMKRLDLMHIAINTYIHETTKILDATPPTSLPDPQTRTLHATLCKAIHQTAQLLPSRSKSLRDLRTMYLSKPVTDFHPLQWTHENLLDLIPALDSSRDLAIEDVVSEKRREHAVNDLKRSLETLHTLQKECTGKLEEVRHFVESMDTLRDAKGVHAHKLRLKLIEEAVAGIKSSKESAMRRIFEVSGVVKAISPMRKVEESSRDAIVGFEESVKVYKKLRSGLVLEISESGKLKDEAEQIYLKAKDIKKSSGDASAKAEQSIVSILEAQAERLKSLAEQEIQTFLHPTSAGGKPSGSGPSEQELLKKITSYLSGPKTSSSTNTRQTEEQDLLLHLLQFQLDRERATTGVHTSSSSDANTTAIHELIQRILDPKSEPAVKANPALAPAPEKPAEPSAEVKANTEFLKFEDTLHSLAITAQQEIIRLQRIHNERQQAVRDAAEAEAKRRVEVDKLSRKAAKVLGDVSTVGMAAGNVGISGTGSTVSGSPRKPYDFNKGSFVGGPGSGSNQIGRSPSNTPQQPQRIFTWSDGSVRRESFYDAEEGYLDARRYMSPLARSEENLDQLADNIDVNLTMQHSQATKAAHVLKKQAEAAKAEYEAKLSLAEQARAKEEELLRMREGLYHTGNNNNSQPKHTMLDNIVHTAESVFGIGHAFGSGPSTLPPSGPRQPTSKTKPKSKMFPDGRGTNSNTKAFPVHIPATTVDESFYQAPEPVMTKQDFASSNLFDKIIQPVKWMNGGSLFLKSDESGSEGSSQNRTSPMRKPVSMTKPGMEDKSVQDIMDGNMESGENHKLTKKLPKKHDSGIGSEISLSKSGRKHGDLSRVVKMESEAVVSHFLAGSSPASE